MKHAWIMRLSLVLLLVQSSWAMAGVAVIAADGSLIAGGDAAHWKLGPEVQAVVAGPSGTFYAASGRTLTRLLERGGVDPTFKPVELNGRINTIVSARDGSGDVIVGGSFTATQLNQPISGIARVRPDGSLDPGFLIGSGFDREVHAIAVARDGKLVVGGHFSSFNGRSGLSGLIRIDRDGAVDEGFDLSQRFFADAAYASHSTVDPTTIYALAIDPEGSIYVGGFFESCGGYLSRNLVKLRSDGTVDRTFTTGAGFQGDVRALALTRDRVCVSGRFFSADRSAISDVACLRRDGSVDPAFNPQTGFAEGYNWPEWAVHAVTALPTGGVLAVGAFRTYQGTQAHGIVALRPDGMIDSQLARKAGFNDEVMSIAPRPGGGWIVGGSFTAYEGSKP